MCRSLSGLAEAGGEGAGHILSPATTAPAMTLMLLSICTILVHVPSPPAGWHSCITRQEDAEHPWTRVPTPPQLPVPLPACLLSPVRMPTERHRTSPLPVTGKRQARCRGVCGHSPAGLSFLFKAVPGTSYTPSAPQPALLLLLHTRLLPPKGKKAEERQTQDRFPSLPSGVIPPPCPELGSAGARRRMPAQKAPAVSFWRCPALPSPEHPTFEHEASFVSESSPEGVGLPPLF